MKTDKRKRVRAIVSLLLAGAVALSMVMTSVIQADAAQSTDSSTLTSWTATTGRDTRNVGRIWTDKTVSDTDIALTGNVSRTIPKGDSDFLIAYSALSSAAKVVGQSVKPLDIVMVLDVSGSMEQGLGYAEIYSDDLDTDRTYYIEGSYGRYREVEYSYRRGGWYDAWGDAVTPKTGPDDTNSGHVQFYEYQNKMQGLQKAAADFIDSTKEANASMPQNQKHRISLIKFAGTSTNSVGDDMYWDGSYYNYTQVVADFTDCEGSGATGLKSSVNNMEAGGATSADYGFNHAQRVFNGEGSLKGARENARKIVIFFTDGEPNHSRDFSTTVANDAIEKSGRLKSDGVIVYTIGVFEDADPSDTNGRFNAYMHGVSSNYPNASSYTNLGDRATDSSGQPTDYYKAASDSASLESVFEDIFQDITRLVAASPTVTDQGNPHRSGYITYTDRLGDYMSVDSFVNLVFADGVYSDPTVSTDGNVTVYTFHGRVENNPVYPQGNLEDVIIRVEKSADLQTGDLVTVQIPASMIPLRYYDVNIDAEGVVTTSISEAYPIRLFYTVSLKDGTEQAMEQPDDALKAYMRANTDENGEVKFFANKYQSGNEVYSSFQPAKTNDFYYFQQDTQLYTDPDCTQKAMAPLDENATYYYSREYYAVGETEVQHNIITISGTDNLAVSGYIRTAQDGSLYVPAGAPRVTSLYNHALNKESNPTGTAPYVTSPTWDNIDSPSYVNEYLGNNGMFTLPQPGTLEVTKSVTADSGLTAPADASFNFTLDLTAPFGRTLKDSYTAAIFNADGSRRGDEFTIADGETFTLKAGQKLYVYGLRAGTDYSVKENNIPRGFTQTQPQNSGAAGGTIASGSVAQAAFVNNYSVTPITVTGDRLGISGTKNITGRQFKAGDIFRFITTASGITPNAPLPTGATVDITPTGGASAGIDFGRFEFTAPGQYRYVIYEYLPGGTDGSNPADTILPGMTYDTVQYRLVVDVADEGDGTLSVSNVAISKRENSSSGVWTELYNSRQLPQQDYVEFTNAYRQQTAQVSFNGTKTLSGKLLSDYSDDEQFQFEIVAGGSRASGSQGEFAPDASQPMPSAGVPNPAGRYIYQNASTGQIVIPAIQLDYTMVGKEYKYTVTELQPTDTGLYGGNALPGAAKNSDGKWVYQGVTFDNSTKEIFVTVFSTSQNGVEEIDYSVSGNGFAFANSYRASAQAQINGVKNITGRTFAPGDEFTFTIRAQTDGAPLPAQTSVTITPSSGSRADVAFGAITFTQADMNGADKAEDSPRRTKEFVYTVTETAGSAGGMTYDSRPKTVTITVTDDGAGNMTATVNPESTTWNNRYASSMTYHGINVEKTLNGRVMNIGEFNFTITPVGDAPRLSAGDAAFANETQRASGMKEVMSKLTGLSFTQADAGKVYTYLVKEEAGSAGGVTYDGSQYTIRITVNDDGAGNITTETVLTQTKDADGQTVDNVIGRYNSADGTIPTVSFTNSYRSTPGTLDGAANLTVTKVLTGRDWQNGDTFTFSLEAADTATQQAIDRGNVVMGETSVSITNASRTKTASFGDIQFTATGTYRFTVKENRENPIPGISYDVSVDTVKVTVTDPGTGTLAVAAEMEYGDLTFTNRYSATPYTLPGATHLNVSKVLAGRDWQPTDFFDFVLTATGDTVNKVTDGTVTMPERTTLRINNDITGSGNTKSMAFGDITFSKPGTYTFTVTETAGTIHGITYDTTPREITVVVADNGQGRLVADSFTVAQAEGLTFTNRYSLGDVSCQQVIGGSKTLTGRDWTDADTFTFNLAADTNHPATAQAIADGTLIMPASLTATANKANNNFAFDAITFKAPGSYQFIVTESDPGMANMTYDSARKTVTVTVTDNFDGTLSSSVTTGSRLGFENVYTPTAPTATLTGTKTLNGRDMAAGEFSFTVTPLDGAPAPVVGQVENTAAADGQPVRLNFGTITFPKADAQCSYTIAETAGSLGGITYDSRVYTVTFDVRYNSASGVYEVTQSITDGTSPAGEVAFVNTYSSAPVTVTGFTGTKIYQDGVTGDPIPMTGGEFSFYIRAVTPSAPMPTPATATNGADGSFAFGSIVFTAPGTYVYTVAETAPTAGGVSSVTQPYTVTITVTDNGRGQLEAVVSGAENLSFTNTYTPGQLTSWVSVRKTLTGRNMVRGEFEFTLNIADEATRTAFDDGLFRFAGGSDSATATNDRDGNVRFGQSVLTFYKDGVFNFTVSEVNKGDGHITYDPTVYNLTATVTDDGNGVLSIVWTGMDTAVFSNTYTPTPTTFTPAAVKTLSGRNMNAGEFTFEIQGLNCQYSAAATNGADGTVNFAPINYTQPGTYTYSITEQAAAAGGVTYDDARYSLEVTVVDNNGQLVATGVYKAADGSEVADVSFANSYKPKEAVFAIGGAKTLDGRALAADEFTFVMKDSAGTEKYAYNAADGSFTFPQITYDIPGEYEYTVTEQKGNLADMTYDASVFTVKVTVTDNLAGNLEVSYKVYKDNSEVSGISFVNYYRPRPQIIPPDTGDDRPVAAYSALMAASAASLAAISLKRKKS